MLLYERYFNLYHSGISVSGYDHLDVMYHPSIRHGSSVNFLEGCAVAQSTKFDEFCR